MPFCSHLCYNTSLPFFLLRFFSFSFFHSPVFLLLLSSTFNNVDCSESETDVGCLLWVRHRSHCQPVWYCRFAWWGCVRGLGIGSSLPQCSTVLEPVTRGTTPSDPLGCKTHCFMFLYKQTAKDQRFFVVHLPWSPFFFSFLFFSLSFFMFIFYFLFGVLRQGVYNISQSC